MEGKRSTKQREAFRFLQKGVCLHPSTTHLLLWDAPGQQRGKGQPLPHDQIDQLKRYLRAQGVAEVRERSFVLVRYKNTIILPRQARDKHRNN